MIHPRYPSLFFLANSALTRQNLPTGKGFGGSSLHHVQAEELVFSIANDSGLANYVSPVYTQQRSHVVVEVGKIVVVALWFWCLVGASFCFDSICTIIRCTGQDI